MLLLILGLIGVVVWALLGASNKAIDSRSEAKALPTSDAQIKEALNEGFLTKEDLRELGLASEEFNQPPNPDENSPAAMRSTRVWVSSPSARASVVITVARAHRDGQFLEEIEALRVQQIINKKLSALKPWMTNEDVLRDLLGVVWESKISIERKQKLSRLVQLRVQSTTWG